MLRRPPFCALVLLIAFFAAACDSGKDEPEQPTPREVADEDYTKTDSGLKYYDFTTGTGAEAQANQLVLVHYNGWFTNGQLFDSSARRNQPISFILGTGDVIPGWDEGIAGMRIGGQRQLVIPPELAYGATGYGPIPPNATLIFEVELVDAITGGTAPNSVPQP
jgi:FKBP-type peptidyl-prolyl cis-trans isomerase